MMREGKTFNVDTNSTQTTPTHYALYMTGEGRTLHCEPKWGRETDRKWEEGVAYHAIGHDVMPVEFPTIVFSLVELLTLWNEVLQLQT